MDAPPGPPPVHPGRAEGAPGRRAPRDAVPRLPRRDGRQPAARADPERSPLTIGRQPASDVALTWDDEVSRAHADIECIGDVWTLVDDGRSRNGSFVNGERVHGRRPLHHGDVVAVGRTPARLLRAAAERRREHRVGRAAGAAAELSPAQRRVLVALCRPFAEGRFATPPSNRELAAELCLSVETVKFHLHALFELFGLAALPQHRKRASLARLALEQGVVTPRELLGEVGRTTPLAICGGRRVGDEAGGPSMADQRGITSRDWDGRISRRTLLRTGGSAAAGLVLLGRTAPARAAPAVPATRSASASPPAIRRPTGSCSGRGSRPPPLEGGGVPPEVLGVRFEVAADEDFHADRAARRDRGAARGGSHRPRRDRGAPAGHAVLVPLQVGHQRSAPSAGRARRRRSAPRPDALRFAFVSCQNYSNGFYPAYGDLAAQQDLELVVHLGDYIYEGAGPTPSPCARTSPAAELLSLSDYRTRHAQYKTDPDLQAAHAALPWLMTWDDHEFKNNYADLDLDPDQPIETSPRGAPRPTSPTGSTRRSRARASPSART